MIKVIELTLRIYVWIMVSLYGAGKIAGGQFYRAGNLPESVAQTTLSNASGFELTWTFFGYSFGYILFIGLSQLIGGFLLLFERTKLLGVAILVPVLLNIIVVDFFYSISNGAMMSAVLYFTSLIIILFLNREKVKSALQVLSKRDQSEKRNLKQKSLLLVSAGFGFLLIFLMEQQMLNFLGR